MVHQRQGLALGLKPPHHLPGVHPQLDDLSAPALDWFPLLGHIHHSKPAFADLLQQLVATNQGARLLGYRHGGGNGGWAYGPVSAGSAPGPPAGEGS